MSAAQRPHLADRLNAWVFSRIHMNNLVYNCCWEDPRLDREAMELGSEDRIAMITSAGCNALDYALDAPKEIHAVDMNPRQNALLELKIAGIHELEWEDFFALFGRGRHESFRGLYHDLLRPRLSPFAREFWDRREGYFAPRSSFYFHGSSGNVARVLNYYIDRTRGLRGNLQRLLEATTLEEQGEIYHRSVRDAFWGRMMRRFVGSNLTLACLGVPRPQRQQVEAHYGGSIERFVESCIESVFTRLPISDNYFWRVYITGSYSERCCPEYLKRQNFARLKAGLVDRVHVHTNTMEGFLRSHPGTLTRYVLLDHMDWLSTYRFEALRSEWEAIADSAAPRARILFRSGGTRVHFLDELTIRHQGRDVPVREMIAYQPQRAAEMHARDRVHTYGSFYIADMITA